MKLFKRIIFGIFASLIVISSSNASVIKESSKDFSGDVYVFGATKFDNNTIVTLTAAGIAGMNEAELQKLLYDEVDTENTVSYYFSDLTKKWSEITLETGELRELSEEEVNKLEDNLYIFYVNNVEKTVELEFNDVIDDNSISSDRVTLVNNLFKVPATVFNFTFTSNGKNVYVDTKKVEDTMEFGTLIVSVNINILDGNGASLDTKKIEYGSSLDKDELDKIYAQDGCRVEYLDSDSKAFNFDTRIEKETDITVKLVDLAVITIGESTYKVDKGSTFKSAGLDEIYKKDGYKVEFYNGVTLMESDTVINEDVTLTVKYIHVGTLLNSEATLDKDTLTITYDGVIKRDDNGNYIELEFLAADDLNTENIFVGTEEVARNWIDKKEVVRLSVNAKKTALSLVIKWDGETETTYNIVFGENAKLTYKVTYCIKSGQCNNVEYVVEGEYTKNHDKIEGVSLKDNNNKVFENEWKKGSTGTKSVVPNEAITKDITVYPFYKTLKGFTYNNESTGYVAKGFKAGDIGEQTIKITYPEFNEKQLKIVANFKDTTDVYDENNYVHFVNEDTNEEIDARDGITITLNDEYVNNINMKVKMDTNKSSKIVFTVYYKDEVLKTYELDSGIVSDEAAVLSFNGSVYSIDKLSSLLALSSDENPVKLLKDVEYAGQLKIVLNKYSAPECLDLNGFTLSGVASDTLDGFLVLSNEGNQAKLAILNIVNGSIVVNDKYNYAIIYKVNTSGRDITLNLEDVDIESGNKGIFINGVSRTLNVTHSSIKTTGVSIDAHETSTKLSNITLEDVDVISDGIAINHPQSGQLTINNSSITGTTPIKVNAGSIKVTNSALTSISSGNDLVSASAGAGYSIKSTIKKTTYYYVKDYVDGYSNENITLYISIKDDNSFYLPYGSEGSIIKLTDTDLYGHYHIDTNLEKGVVKPN